MERQPLGKGLAALISEQNDDALVRNIPIERIRANPLQPRKAFDAGSLEELVASIRQYGVIQPLIVRQMANESFVLIAGERRFRAAALAGLAHVPCLVRAAEAQAMLEVALIENLQRDDLNPMEEAEAYQQLAQQFGLTHDAIAERLGKSRVVVSNALRLLQLPEPVREMLRAGKLSPGHARALLTLREPAIQRALAKKAADTGMTVRDLENAAKQTVSPSENERPAAQRPPPATTRSSADRPVRMDPDAARIERKLSELFGTRVQLQGTMGNGRIVIDFYGDEDLGRVLDLMGIL